MFIGASHRCTSSVRVGIARLLLGRCVDPPLGENEQAGDDDHRSADQECFVPSALVGEKGRCDRTHRINRTAGND